MNIVFRYKLVIVLVSLILQHEQKHIIHLCLFQHLCHYFNRETFKRTVDMVMTQK